MAETATPVPEFVTADRLPGASLALAPANTELDLPTDTLGLAYEVADRRISKAQIAVLRKSVNKDLTDDQFLVYLARCARKGVDPFDQAYGFPNENGGVSFGLRIDGMRALAMRTGELDSRVVETIWAKVPEGAQPDYVPKMLGARCTIVRKGCAGPFAEEAWMEEYGRSSAMWAKFPETMIRKVAESKALRAAFPDALSGTYEPAEME